MAPVLVIDRYRHVRDLKRGGIGVEQDLDQGRHDEGHPRLGVPEGRDQLLDDKRDEFGRDHQSSLILEFRAVSTKTATTHQQQNQDVGHKHRGDVAGEEDRLQGGT